MEKIVVVFIVCSLVNVILSTLKTLIMVNAGEKMSILINAICYGFYTLVVKQLTSVDYMTAVIVTIMANIVGVWISYRIMNFFKKDKLWKIEATFKYSVDFLDSLKMIKPDSEAKVIIMALTIRDARNRANGQGDYLKQVKFPKF